MLRRSQYEEHCSVDFVMQPHTGIYAVHERV